MEALDGVNAGFRFHGMGAGQTSGLLPTKTNEAYGGVVYGYNDVMVRIWLPILSHGHLVMVGDGWGNGEKEQKSNSVKLLVTVARFVHEPGTLPFIFLQTIFLMLQY